ncbi:MULTISPECIES: hypothetical protein [unclassified Sphingomonas]|uniref:hypothetical protein n=1 Tax=unclassified Sphingomonas TaxID=196159 RepID=UPI002151FAB3|nr:MULTISPECIES: hypothetical protein [unclassified Sphingomonas]MCR5870462.1 hypothetical protein [Sphingomonas sp. J344]UUY01193.1 hypothetical protein LRS08_09245 [Sphingomonas sp. J315]
MSTAAANAAFAESVQLAIAPRFAGLADADAVLAAARALLADHVWIADLIAPLVDHLRTDPWFDPALRFTRDVLRTAVVLADLPEVTLTASVTSAAALAQLALPATVVLSGRRALTRYVRADGAQMRRWRLADDAPHRCVEVAPLHLRDGELIALDGGREGRLIVAAPRDVVAITATAKPGADALMHEFSTSDGHHVRSATADDRASRAELLLALLRASGRSDAADSFDAISRDSAFHLRWAAMREWLMLDARAARPRLAEMAASDPDPGVRSAAAQTLQRLDARIAA